MIMARIRKGKPRPAQQIMLPTGDIGIIESKEEDEDVLDDNADSLDDEEALELLVIKDNLGNFPEIQTVEDLFDAIKVPHIEQTDFKLATLMREVLTYPVVDDEEETNDNEVGKKKLNDEFVTIPTEGLYAKFDIDEKLYSLVYQIAFLKADKFVPKESDGMTILPFLGKKVEDKEIKGNGLSPAYLVTCNAIKSHENIDELKKFFVRTNLTTEPFVCGEFIYSMTKGIIGQHGVLNAENVQALKDAMKQGA